MMSERKIFFAFVLLAFSACTNAPREDEAIARVNRKSITVRDYLTSFETLKPKEMSMGGKERSELKNLVIKNLVKRAAILTESERKKISITDQELEKGMKRYKEDYGQGVFEQSLLEQMIDENEWKEQIRQNLLMEKLFAASEPRPQPPTPREISEFYEANPQLFRKPAQATALQIVVNDMKTAEEIRSQLRKKPKDFLVLMKKYSSGPEAQADGKIKIAKGVLPESLDRILFEGRIGDITNIISSPYGFHILKILDRTPTINLDYDQARDDIAKHLLQERRAEWLMKYEEKLLRNSQIEYNRKLISKL
ncbi:MAG: peptidyl-prolyl cis-trans isomerase [Deltaproteobacteria bacterium]|nr:peptidyl-prolyl cis-trans isomerase [Deltaproteobacteria bacterium]